MADVPVKRKWKSLKSECAEPVNDKPICRVRTIVKKRKVSTKSLQKRGRRAKKSARNVGFDETHVSDSSISQEDPGYIIIPQLEKPKRGRKRLLKKDTDPEFVAVLKTEPVSEQSGRRRSSRGSVMKWSFKEESEEFDMKP